MTGVSYRRRRVKPTPTMPSAPKSKEDGSGTGLDTGEEARLNRPSSCRPLFESTQLQS